MDDIINSKLHKCWLTNGGAKSRKMHSGRNGKQKLGYHKKPFVHDFARIDFMPNQSRV